MRILFIGDIYAGPGRAILRDTLPALTQQYAPDLIVANGENAAGGFGITGAIADDLFTQGIDVITTGNHAWDRKEILPYLATAGRADSNAARLLRPANYPPGAPGEGCFRGRARNGEPYAVLNLQGRVFLPALDCPFRKADELLAALAPECRTVLVDMHAEASSEKQAMGWYLDGRVSAVVGTHTHVPTADERILPGGTAFQTDAGMTGAYAGVIGSRKEEALERLLQGRPNRLEAASGDVRLCGLFIATAAGRATEVERIQRKARAESGPEAPGEAWREAPRKAAQKI